LIRFTLRQSADPEVDTFDPDDPDLPDVVDRHFRKVTKTLRPLGFEVVEGLALPNQTPRVKALVLMYANRAEKDAAIATVMYAKRRTGPSSKPPTSKSSRATATARWCKRTTLRSSARSRGPRGGARPHVTTTQFPTVRDAARLYRLHQVGADGLFHQVLLRQLALLSPRAPRPGGGLRRRRALSRSVPARPAERRS